MSVPSQTAIHAACVVGYSGGSPAFVGIGNQGFLPFGANDAQHSFRVGVGLYYMRLVAPLDVVGGAGIVIPTTTSLDPTVQVRCAPLDSRTLGAIVTQGGNPIDLPFTLTVIRLPQSLEG